MTIAPTFAGLSFLVGLVILTSNLAAGDTAVGLVGFALALVLGTVGARALLQMEKRITLLEGP